MRPLANGELELSMELASLEEIERWVLSWGELATVREPMAMIRRVREVPPVSHAVTQSRLSALPVARGVCTFIGPKYKGATFQGHPAKTEGLERFLKRFSPRESYDGGGKGIRTPGLFIANEALYQLSYTPIDWRSGT
jgi:hypothetical protein